MSLLTLARYRTLTGDTTSADAAVTAVLAGAQSIVEDHLHRKIENAEYTETLTVYPGGRVYPSAIPITEVDEGYEIDGFAIVGISPAFPDSWITPSYAGNTAEVTYTGGWTTSTVPYAVELGLARVAQALISLSTPISTSVPANVKSLSVEGYSVTFGDLGAGSTGDLVADRLLSGYKRRLV